MSSISDGYHRSHLSACSLRQSLFRTSRQPDRLRQNDHLRSRIRTWEKTGANVNFEFAGKLPEQKTGFVQRRMFSYADGFEVTPLQLERSSRQWPTVENC